MNAMLAANAGQRTQLAHCPAMAAISISVSSETGYVCVSAMPRNRRFTLRRQTLRFNQGASVSGHPPHFSTHSFFPAAMKSALSRSRSGFPRRTRTFGGSCSPIAALSAGPRAHFCQYGRFAITLTPRAPPGIGFISAGNNGGNKINDACQHYIAVSHAAVVGVFPDVTATFRSRHAPLP